MAPLIQGAYRKFSDKYHTNHCFPTLVKVAGGLIHQICKQQRLDIAAYYRFRPIVLRQ